MLFGLGERLRRTLVAAEYWRVYLAGRHLNIEYVVRYLRAPNPQLVPRILRAFGATVGERTSFKYSLCLDNVTSDANSTGTFSHLHIGDNCYVGDGVYFDLADEVWIGSNSMVSGRASFVTHEDCNRSEWLFSVFPRQTAPIRVEEGSWIGFGSILLLGAVVGECGMIAANSLVRGQTAPRCLYAGMPARLIRQLGRFQRQPITEGIAMGRDE